MTDISSIGMVSYYNPLAMYRQQQQQQQQQQSSTVATVAHQQLSQQAQQHVAQAQHAVAQQQAAVVAAAAAAADTSPTQQYWYGYPHGHPAHGPHHHHHHHQTSGAQQYLEHAADVLAWPPHPHAHHYSHHLQYPHHTQVAYQQHQQQQQQLNGTVSEWSGDESSPHNHHQQSHQAVGSGEPSPPITVSGSELSCPGTPATPPANNNNNTTANNNNNNNNGSTTPMRPSQIRSPYEWMKKPSYQSQPNPACNVAAINTGAVTGLHELCTLDALGKTRTKDKYRVVYTDHQRLELEKEFHYSRYITIRRKAELAANLALSERQVKIWFQNRRAKERKQSKKREEMEHKDMKPGDMSGNGGAGGMASLAALGGMSGMLGGLMHNGSSPPLNLGPASHHGIGPIHAHNQHAHSHAVLGL